MRPFSTSAPPRPNPPPFPIGGSSWKWLGGGRDDARIGSGDRFDGGGDLGLGLGLGERDAERGVGGGERARVVSGAVSW